jgi:hypothetical protein
MHSGDVVLMRDNIMNTNKRTLMPDSIPRWLIAAGIAVSLMVPLSASADHRANNDAVNLLIGAATAYALFEIYDDRDSRDVHHRRHGYDNRRYDRDYRYRDDDRRYRTHHDGRRNKHRRHHAKHYEGRRHGSDSDRYRRNNHKKRW